MTLRYPTIYDATAACRQSFEECVTEPYLMKNEWAEDRLADFNLWSDGAGASAGGLASLDSRLESWPDIKHIVINLLRMLVILLGKCRGTAQDIAKKYPLELPHLATTLPGDTEEALLVMNVEMQSTISTEGTDDAIAAERERLKQNSERVENVMKEIIRLTAAIRKSGLSSRFRKADSRFKSEDYEQLTAHLEFMLTVYPTQDCTQIPQRDPSKISPIQRRLIEANLRRRNRFLYQQKHSEKLAVKENPSAWNFRGQIISIWLIAKMWIFDLLQLWLIPGAYPQPLHSPPRVEEAPHPEIPLSSTLASEVETSIKIEQPQGPSTVGSSTALAVEYPQPPKIKPGSKLFKCPCCCQYLSIETAQKTRWRKHLANDVQPYTCILEDCPRPLDLFETRKLWMKHMQIEHKSRQYWCCPDVHCSSRRPFENEKDFASHFQVDHPESIPNKDMQLLISACTRSVPLEIKSCPLCPSEANTTDVEATLLLEHIAVHMHSFSLKSLPDPPEEDDSLHHDLLGADAYFLRNPYFDIGSHAEKSAYNLDTLSNRSLDGFEPLIYDDDNDQNLAPYVGSSDGSKTWISAMPDRITTSAKQDTSARKQAASRLHEQLFEELIQQRPESQIFYIPEDKKLEKITLAVIEEQVRLGAPRDVAFHVKAVQDHSRNLFTILAYNKRAYEIHNFIKEGISDADLPFSYESATSMLRRRNGDEILSVREWGRHKRLKLSHTQWRCIAPVFSGQNHYEFNENIILPFTDKTLVSKGAYSEVYEAKIHQAHHNWHQGPGHSALSVAIKKLHLHDENEFQKERTTLVALEANNHLVKLLFSYEFEGYYHLVFLRAKGNLRDYWEQVPEPQITLETILWSLGQMRGLARALHTIHNFQVSIPLSMTETEMETPQGKALMSVSQGEERFGRHGDLKPENILWYQDSEGDVFQITDFGLGRFHGRDTRTKSPPYTIFSSPTYEPPECHIYLPVSRAYDLWSLGCLFLEWVSWMLRGSEAIDTFSQSRMEKSFILNSEGRISDDYFWSLVIKGTNKDARVRNGVEKWVLDLHNDPKCSQLIHDLLKLIMKDLLCIVPKQRSNAAQLNLNLHELLERAKSDQDYALTPCPWVSKTSDMHQRSSIIFIISADSRSSDFTLQQSRTWPAGQLCSHQTSPLDHHQLDMTHTESSPAVRPRRRSRQASVLWRRVLHDIDRGAFRNAALKSQKLTNELDNHINSTYGCIMTL